MNSLIHNKYSLFTKGLPTFTMINSSNLMKHIMKLDAYWCNEKFNIILGLGNLRNNDTSLNHS